MRTAELPTFGESMMSTDSNPPIAVPADGDEAALFEKVAEALQGIHFGEVVVVVVDGQVDRIDRIQKSRPYKAPRESRS